MQNSDTDVRFGHFESMWKTLRKEDTRDKEDGGMGDGKYECTHGGAGHRQAAAASVVRIRPLLRRSRLVKSQASTQPFGGTGHSHTA